jgi:hypothetical protein
MPLGIAIEWQRTERRLATAVMYQTVLLEEIDHVGIFMLATDEAEKPAYRLSSGDCDRHTPGIHRRGAKASVRRY